MNLSHNGNMSTTNVVWKNLEKSIKQSVASISITESQLQEYYNQEYNTLSNMRPKLNIILRGLNDFINKRNNKGL